MFVFFNPLWSLWPNTKSIFGVEQRIPACLRSAILGSLDVRGLLDFWQARLWLMSWCNWLNVQKGLAVVAISSNSAETHPQVNANPPFTTLPKFKMSFFCPEGLNFCISRVWPCWICGAINLSNLSRSLRTLCLMTLMECRMGHHWWLKMHRHINILSHTCMMRSVSGLLCRYPCCVILAHFEPFSVFWSKNLTTQTRCISCTLELAFTFLVLLQ